jgi:hypothetical protein
MMVEVYMRLKSVTTVLVFILLLTACGYPISTLPAISTSPAKSTETASIPTTVPTPVNPTNPPTPYPEPGVGTPTTSAYPQPNLPGTSSPTIPASGYEPQPGDNNLKRDQVFLDLANSQVATKNAEPGQGHVTLQGNLPDPCHSLRVVVSPPDENYVINLDVYSVVDPSTACNTVLKPFTADIPLGSYSSGQYTVMVNGEKLGKYGTGYQPQPGDKQLTHGEVFIDMDSSQVYTSVTQPGQASVFLKGDLPTPCNQLRVAISEPADNNVINLEVYSVVDPNVRCTDVLQLFSVTIPLGNYPSGHYTVTVNGEKLGEFDA